MSEVVILRGLPGSGKSTWSKEQVATNLGQTKRVSKDDLRAMLDGGKWSKSNEKFVLAVRDAIIRQALQDNCHLLIDDTNLADKHGEHIRHLVSEVNKQEGKQHRVRIQDFTDVPLETCIERDLKRESSVGEKVIRNMHHQFLQKVQPPPTYDPDLPNAVLSDMDGTLALLNGRNPYDASTCDADGLNTPVVNAIEGFRNVFPGLKVILMSGRPEKHRAPTEAFLVKHAIHYDALLMRGDEDWRKDDVVKRELYEAHVQGKYNVQAVFDDRESVCVLWHSIGLPLFRVGDPTSTF